MTSLWINYPVFIAAEPETVDLALRHLNCNGVAVVPVARSRDGLKLFIFSSSGELDHTEIGPISETSLLQLRMIARGMTNAEIAHRMGRPENTVKGNLRSLFKALGARDRAHAVLIACQAGLI